MWNLLSVLNTGELWASALPSCMALGPMTIPWDPWLKPMVLKIHHLPSQICFFFFPLSGSFSQEMAPSSHYPSQNLEVVHDSFLPPVLPFHQILVISPPSFLHCFHFHSPGLCNIISCPYVFNNLLKLADLPLGFSLPTHCSLKATMIVLKEKFDHLNPILKTFPWSPITFRIKFKFLRFYQHLLTCFLLTRLTPSCSPLTKAREPLPHTCWYFFLPVLLFVPHTNIYELVHVLSCTRTVLNTVSSTTMRYLHCKKKKSPCYAKSCNENLYGKSGAQHW